MKSRNFLTCLHEAEIFYHLGKRKMVIRRLEEALAIPDLRQPMQKLPAWVRPGEHVRWTGEAPNHVYKVAQVNRDKPAWWFMGERILEDGSEEIMRFRREPGKRYWERASNPKVKVKAKR